MATDFWVILQMASAAACGSVVPKGCLEAESTEPHKHRWENALINNIIASTGTVRLTKAERRALDSLRSRCQTAQHVFTERELERLQFLRWLINGPNWDPALDQPDAVRERLVLAPEAMTWSWIPGSLA